MNAPAVLLRSPFEVAAENLRRKVRQPIGYGTGQHHFVSGFWPNEEAGILGSLGGAGYGVMRRLRWHRSR